MQAQHHFWAEQGEITWQHHVQASQRNFGQAVGGKYRPKTKTVQVYSRDTVRDLMGKVKAARYRPYISALEALGREGTDRSEEQSSVGGDDVDDDMGADAPGGRTEDLVGAALAAEKASDDGLEGEHAPPSPSSPPSTFALPTPKKQRVGKTLVAEAVRGSQCASARSRSPVDRADAIA